MDNKQAKLWVRTKCRFAAPLPLNWQADHRERARNTKQLLDKLDRAKPTPPIAPAQNEQEIHETFNELPSNQMPEHFSKNIGALKELVEFAKNPSFPSFQQDFAQNFPGKTPDEILDVLQRLENFAASTTNAK
jgi:hypothetical protein